MSNVVAALPNIDGALCAMPQSLADAHCCSNATNAKPVEISWGAPNYRIDLSRQWAEVRHVVRTSGRDIAA